MLLFDVVTTFDKAVVGQRAGTRDLAFLTVLNAILFRCGRGTHLFTHRFEGTLTPNGQPNGMQLACRYGVY